MPLPSPVQISPSQGYPVTASYEDGLSQSLSQLSASGGMRSPTSPRPSSFLPSFMRRPRAATLDRATSSPPPSANGSFFPSNNGSTSPQPQPSSSESLQMPSSPSIMRRRMTATTPSSPGGLPSPPLSSSHQADPLAAFGHRLLRRISNQGGSASSANGAAHPAGSSSTRPTSAGTGAGGRSVSVPAQHSAHLQHTSASAPPEAQELQRETPRGEQPPVSTIIITNPSNPVPSSNADQPPQPASSSALLPSPSAPAPTHRLRLVPLLDASHSLPFDPVVRDVRESATESSGVDGYSLKIGRFTDKQSGADGTPRGGALNSTKVAFKSKVVSRCHAEVWAGLGGKFFVKDTKSSSGTFLNHIRLSPPSVESKPFAIKDGDVIQLGVDYQGGTEEIYRCVKMKVELGRGWQSGANTFNTNALMQLNALRGDEISLAEASGAGKEKAKRPKANVTDCVICLFSVTICQSLFIAPCSHVFHYKCIRPLLSLHHPGFSCPVCRSFADLEADVETEDAYEPVSSSRRESLISRKGSLKSVRQAFEQALGSALQASEVPPPDDDDDDVDDHFDAEPSRSGLRPFGSPLGVASRIAAAEADGARPESSGRPETAVALPRTADLGYSPGFGERLLEAETPEEFAGGGASVRARPIPSRNETLANNEDVHADIGGGSTFSSHPTLAGFPSASSSSLTPAESPIAPEEGTGAGLVAHLGRVEELETISEGGGEGMVRSGKMQPASVLAVGSGGDDGEGSTGGSSAGA